LSQVASNHWLALLEKSNSGVNGGWATIGEAKLILNTMAKGARKNKSSQK
jgi:hypothetical protein